ncbi:hypothetical protein Golob_007111, partial [Gossypium lobatum]|nr:hypothetical protein [Gossypium lobatum]
MSDRMIEDEKFERKLKPLGFTIKESGGFSPYAYQELREMVAAYMRKHAYDFLPFFLSENAIDGDSDDSPAERFENYCKEVESTAAWGGQLELGALTHCLRKHIMMYSGSFPDVEMGKEYKFDGGSSSSTRTIRLSYHKYAFGFEEHYNSVFPDLNIQCHGLHMRARHHYKLVRTIVFERGHLANQTGPLLGEIKVHLKS